MRPARAPTRTLRPGLLALPGLALLASGVAMAREPAADWHSFVAQADQRRLHRWRDAWVAALAGARAGGAGAAVAEQGALLQPDAALDDPAAPDGAYRCRVVKLGSAAAAGLAYVAYPEFHCAIDQGRFTKLDGSQRPTGRLLPLDARRMLFVGTLALGDEAQPIAYARDPDRDMIGVLERIGPRRWRLVFPYPRFESLLDVIELVPASSG